MDNLRRIGVKGRVVARLIDRCMIEQRVNGAGILASPTNSLVKDD